MKAWRALMAAVALGAAVAGARGEDPQGWFARGNAAYAEGRFDEALDAYEQAVSAGTSGANLFYNAGNSAYRAGKKGEALLWYERALLLDPGHPEAKANRAFVRDQTGARLPEMPVWRRMFAGVSPGVAATLLAASCWALLLLAAAGARRGLAWLGYAGAGALAAWCAAALCFAERPGEIALVTADHAGARLAPERGAKLAAQLPAGSPLRVIQDSGPWLYCELPDKSRAWIGAEETGRLVPGKP